MLLAKHRKYQQTLHIHISLLLFNKGKVSWWLLSHQAGKITTPFLLFLLFCQHRVSFPQPSAVNYRVSIGDVMEKIENCPAQSPVTNEGSSPLGCIWAPLSARIVSLMFRGLFIYLGYISFFKHSAVRFIIELYVCNLGVPLGLFCRVLLYQLPPQWVGVQGTALQCGLRGCPWNNQFIDCVCKWNSLLGSPFCLILVLPSSPSRYLHCKFLLIERKKICPPFSFFFFFSPFQDDRIQIIAKYLWKFLLLSAWNIFTNLWVY